MSNVRLDSQDTGHVNDHRTCSGIGLNSTVKEAELTHAHNYLVYKIMVIDEDMKKYKVIVDPGNGEILMKKEITWYDDHEKMKCEEKDGKYGHDYNKMKDKKY